MPQGRIYVVMGKPTTDVEARELAIADTFKRGMDKARAYAKTHAVVQLGELIHDDDENVADVLVQSWLFENGPENFVHEVAREELVLPPASIAPAKGKAKGKKAIAETSPQPEPENKETETVKKTTAKKAAKTPKKAAAPKKTAKSPKPVGKGKVSKKAATRKPAAKKNARTATARGSRKPRDISGLDLNTKDGFKQAIGIRSGTVREKLVDALLKSRGKHVSIDVLAEAMYGGKKGATKELRGPIALSMRGLALSLEKLPFRLDKVRENKVNKFALLPKPIKS